MSDVIFWGATGQAKVLNEALSGTNFRLVALVDNRDIVSPFADIPVLRGKEGLDAWLDERGGIANVFGAVAIGGGRGRDRLELIQFFRTRGLAILTIIHRTAFVASSAHVDEGSQILAQAAVCTHARLGAGVIVNTAASIDHDCILGNGVHIAPGARVAGEVIIEDGAFIGAGAVILPRIHIGADSIVGAGAIVTKNVQPGTVVIGNPARPHKTKF